MPDLATPQRFSLIEPNYGLGLVLIVSGGFIGVVNLAMIGDALRNQSVPAFIPLAMAAIIAATAVAILAGLHLLLRKATATIGTGSVSVRRRSLWGAGTTDYPLSAYLGVMGQTVRVAGTSRRGRSRTAHAVVLVPGAGTDAPAIEVFRTAKEDKLRAGLETWARRLSVAIVTADEDGRIEARDVADLDRNLLDRLRHQTLTVNSLDLAGGPPPGLLSAEIVEGALLVRRLTPVYPVTEVLKIMAILGAFGFGPVFFQVYFGLVLALPAIAYIAWMAHRDRQRRTGLTVTPDAIVTFRTDLDGSNRTETGRVALSAIEEIRLERSALYFIGDRSRLDFGGYLPLPSRQWLRARILTFLHDQQK